MTEFFVYIKLGWFHIANLNAYDHILFLLALCGVYTLKNYKPLFWLVTAFTLGHSATLILASLGVFQINAELIEFLIPVTIFITAVANFFISEKNAKKLLSKYLVAFVFGLIHGLGFSSYFKSLIGEGIQLIKILFAFNVGIEVGQLLIVAVIVFFVSFLNEFLKIRLKVIQYVISTLAAVVAIFLMIQTKFW